MADNYNLIKVPVVPTALPILGEIPLFDMQQVRDTRDLPTLIQAQNYIENEIVRAKSLLPSVTSGWLTFVHYCAGNSFGDAGKYNCDNAKSFRFYKDYLDKVIGTYPNYSSDIAKQLTYNGTPADIAEARARQLKIDNPPKDYTVAIVLSLFLILAAVITVIIIRKRKKKKSTT